MSHLGLMFTNSSHRVIFVDDKLRKILRYEFGQLTKILGMPACETFGMTEGDYLSFLAQFKLNQQGNEIEVRVYDALGHEHRLLTEVRITQDMHRKLLGVDYKFSHSQEKEASSNEAVISADDFALICTYSEAQLLALYALTEEWAGQKLSQYLVTLNQEIAQNEAWDIEISRTSIRVGKNLRDSNILLALLTKTAAYSKKLLGATPVIQRIESINKTTSTSVFKHIDQNWYQNL
jgi:hypothetical protein